MTAYPKITDLTDAQLASLIDHLSGGGYFAMGLAECLRASAWPMSTSLYSLANAAMEWADHRHEEHGGGYPGPMGGDVAGGYAIRFGWGRSKVEITRRPQGVDYQEWRAGDSRWAVTVDLSGVPEVEREGHFRTLAIQTAMSA